MIINIRGTSGSGKSTIVRKLLDNFPHTPVWDNSSKPKVLGYQLDDLGGRRVRIVGKYETPCGGCDGIKTQDEVEQRVRDWHELGYDVLFEGLLISHIYGRWAKLAKDVGTGNMLFAFLDTPLEVCLERVKARRVARGNDTPFNETNTRQKWADARRVCAKAKADGLNALWFNADALYEQLSGSHVK